MIPAILFITFVVSASVTYMLSKSISFLGLIDAPNERSLHSTPTSRAGGIAILVSIILSVLIITVFSGFPVSNSFIWIWFCVALIAAISLIDDRISLSPLSRFIFHIISAAFLIYGGYMLETLIVPGYSVSIPSSLAVLLTGLFIIWMLNLYNFMDGMDGFAAGMAVIGFLTMAILAWETGAMMFCVTSLVIAVSCLGFLVFNFPPAKIFMGDVGSSTLGLLVAIFSLWADRDGLFPFWVALLIFSPFIVDASITLLHRLLRGERIWQAHKSHYYQRLVLLGLGHKRTVLWEYLLMVLCAISALFAVRTSVAFQWVIILLWLIIYSSLIYTVNYLERKKSIA